MPFSVPPMVTAFTLRKALQLRNVSFFFYLLPWSRLAGSCFRSVGLFSSWLEWWLPLVEVFGGVTRSLSSASGFSPLQVPWVPGYLVSLALALSSYCLRHVRLRAATTATPVPLTLRLPGFPRKLQLRGCRQCLRLRILSRRSPLGRSLCSVFHLRLRLLLT